MMVRWNDLEAVARLNLPFSDAEWEKDPEEYLGQLVTSVYDRHRANCCRFSLLTPTTEPFDPSRSWNNIHSVLLPFVWGKDVEPLYRVVQNFTNLFERVMEERFFHYLDQNCEHVVFHSFGRDTILAYLENSKCTTDLAGLFSRHLPKALMGCVAGPKKLYDFYTSCGAMTATDGRRFPVLLYKGSLPRDRYAYLLPLPTGKLQWHKPVWTVVESDRYKMLRVTFSEEYEFRWSDPLSCWTKI